MRSLSAFPGLQLASLLCLALTGCSLSTTATPTPDAGLAIQGRVMGGQQPITGAHVYLFAANTTGYGGSGIAASTSNASVSLLKAASTGFSDSVGAYVPTGSGGSFSITGDYSCTPNTQVYLYASGGNPGLTGGTNNTASGLLAALGNCPSVGNFLTATPYIVINEVSTIATAYAFAGFASDATHVSSSGTALAQTGIANAFANATNLETLSTGAVLATTPAGNGTVPQSTINTLANILAACINTTGTVSGPTNPTACYTLFTSALSAGTTGTLPADTATAAINIAHNPSLNIASLYGLSTATSPFIPALTSAPNDWTIGVSYTGGGLIAPWGIAVDGSGNVWVANNSDSGSDIISKFSTTGAAISGSSGYSGTGLLGATSIAIDASGSVWVRSGNSNEIGKFNSSGTMISGPLVTAGGGCCAIAVDGSGDVWVPSYYTPPGIITEYSSSGTLLSGSGYTGGGLNDPSGAGIDGSGNVWVSNLNGLDVSKFSSSGVAISGSTGFTGGGALYTHNIAIDSSGNVWTLNYWNTSLSKFAPGGTAISSSSGYTGGGLPTGTASNYVSGYVALDGAGNVWVTSGTGSDICEFSSSGTAISGSSGYTIGGLNNPVGIAIDGSGNVWVANENNEIGNSIVEFIGASTPVITPIAAGLPATPTSDGSSKLGTRP